MIDLRKLSDEALVKRVIDQRFQDESSFAELVRRYQGRVFATCLRMMEDTHLAEDMTQEALFRAYRKLASFEGRSSFSTWLYRLTVNVCLNELKRLRRTVHLPLDELNEFPLGPNQVGSDPDQAHQQEFRQALNELPEQYREILQLRELEGRSYQEIASRMEISLSAAKMRVQRARAVLLARMQTTLEENV